MEIILLGFFVFVILGYATKTSKPSDHRRRNYNDSHDSSFDETTDFINPQYATNHIFFDSNTDHCSSDNCCDNSCSDSNCDCGSSDGGSCD